MKKITLLLGLAFLAFSCSSDDDGSSAEDLIGEWSLSQEFIGEEEEEVSECEQLNTLVFTSETITTIIHFEEAEEGSCIVENIIRDEEGNIVTEVIVFRDIYTRVTE